jgi:hypothetical protein
MAWNWLPGILPSAAPKYTCAGPAVSKVPWNARARTGSRLSTVPPAGAPLTGTERFRDPDGNLLELMTADDPRPDDAEGDFSPAR